MTGVINVGVRLPAVIFPVVIRPSGGLTPLISLSVSLFSVSACLSSCVAQSVSLSLSIFLHICLNVFLHLYLSSQLSSHFSFRFSLFVSLSHCAILNCFFGGLKKKKNDLASFSSSCRPHCLLPVAT